MSALQHKIDFLGLISVKGANPNGDPLNGGRPRIDSDGYGMMTDVCIKRKLRNRLQEMGESIFVAPPEGEADTLASRARKLMGLSRCEMISTACSHWFDVRCFGQVFSFMGRDAENGTVNIRGPVTIQRAVSADPVEIEEIPLTRCINGSKQGKRASDTFGFTSYVRYGLYLLKGSVNVHFAAKTGFSAEDAELLKAAIVNIFRNDSSSARPDGTMCMERLYWWEHNTAYGNFPTYAVHNSVKIRRREGIEVPLGYEDYIVEHETLDGVSLQILGGF